jgi:2,4-dienoyl-CoA reductase (NADPH2)
MQRKKTKMGATLGKTTGWIHRLALKYKNVKMLNAVQYDKIDDKGLHITRKGKEELLEVDNVIICAGQYSNNELFEPLKEKGVKVHIIGGAFEAGELDAKRAIEQGSRLAAEL